MDTAKPKTAIVEIAGEQRCVKFDLLAFDYLGVNPFKPASVVEFMAQELTMRLAARLICAGLQHEYHGRNATRRGQAKPEPEDILADMDTSGFVATWQSVSAVLGEDEVTEAKKDPDPPTA